MQEQMDKERYQQGHHKRDYAAYDFKFYLEFALVNLFCSLLGCALGFFLSALL